MNSDPELDAWQKQWQTHDTVPSDLRTRVEREIRMGRYLYVAPIAVTLVFGGGALGWAIRSGQPRMVVLACAVWIFIAITWGTGLALARRVGQRPVPEASTTTAFLDFTIRTCRGRRAAIAAAAVLYPIFLIFVLVWRYQTGNTPGLGAYLLSDYVLGTAAVTCMLGMLAARQHRILSLELESLRAMRQRFENGVERV